ncbi:MAG: hypothetical protein ABWK00_00635 [Desulfurococcaceae archaeon]
MGRYPRVELVGFDSMGVRGMATHIVAGGLEITIDPGANLAPRRFGLPPHRLELQALDEALARIRAMVSRSDYVVISHYHRDHYLYRNEEVELYRGKTVLAKAPDKTVSFSQRLRARDLYSRKPLREGARVLWADSSSLEIDDGVRLEFSRPVPHGPRGSRLGNVIMTFLEIDGYRIVHASDVQGPANDEALSTVLAWSPDLLIISGPPTYLEGGRGVDVEAGMRGLSSLISGMKEGSTLIVDHHLLRDLRSLSIIDDLRRKGASRGIKVLTAAEFMGLENTPLEAMRRQLWARGT